MVPVLRDDGKKLLRTSGELFLQTIATTVNRPCEIISLTGGGVHKAKVLRAANHYRMELE